MTLAGDLYRILSVDRSGQDESFEVEVALMLACVIFSAHFPGMPVTPGVCLVEMATELLTSVRGGRMRLGGASEIKFIEPVFPASTQVLRYSFAPVCLAETGEDWRVLLRADNVLHARMTLHYGK